jgi:diamine N-acetyltransferase
MILSNENIKLRALEPSDVEFLYQWENHPDVWKVSNTHMPISKYMLANYIKSSDRDIWESHELRLVVENKDGKPVGTVEVFDFDPYHMRAGIGVIVFEEDERRKGIATDAINLLGVYLKNEVGVYQLYANVSEDNSSSIRLFEKLGFELIGVKKKWLRSPSGWNDERMYQKFL